MYKITIKETVAEVSKETIIETDDFELAKQILVSAEIIKVETDIPNESIDDNLRNLQKAWEDARKIPTQPYPPYRTGDGWPYPTTPFTVTC